MTDALDPDTRDKLLADPGAILGDRDLMRALVSAREADSGGKVIDIRGRAMEALETRLDRLEATHEGVISAAFDNQSGMAMIHRAVLGLLETDDLADFMAALQADVAPQLRIETLCMIVEPEPHLDLPQSVAVVPEGTIDRIVSAGRRTPRGDDIVLRAAMVVTRPLHGRTVASEALLPLDLGVGRPRAVLLMGSDDAGRFMPVHGTDLLRFFGQVFRLALLARLPT